MLHYYLAATNQPKDCCYLLIQDQADSWLAIAVVIVRQRALVTTDAKLDGTDLSGYAISWILCLSDFAILTIAYKASQQRYHLLNLGGA